MSKKSASKSNSKSNKKEIIFRALSSADVHNLDFDDPNLIQQLTLDDLLSYNDKTEYEECREGYMKACVFTAVIEQTREKIFEKIKKLKPESAEELLNENSDKNEQSKKIKNRFR